MQDKRETLTIIFYYLFTKHSVNSVVIRAVFGRQSDSTFVDRVRVRVAFTREMETRKKANRCTIATRTRDKLRIRLVWELRSPVENTVRIPFKALPIRLDRLVEIPRFIVPLRWSIAWLLVVKKERWTNYSLQRDMFVNEESFVYFIASKTR